MAEPKTAAPQPPTQAPYPQQQQAAYPGYYDPNYYAAYYQQQYPGYYNQQYHQQGGWQPAPPPGDPPPPGSAPAAAVAPAASAARVPAQPAPPPGNPPASTQPQQPPSQLQSSYYSQDPQSQYNYNAWYHHQHQGYQAQYAQQQPAVAQSQLPPWQQHQQQQQQQSPRQQPPSALQPPPWQSQPQQQSPRQQPPPTYASVTGAPSQQDYRAVPPPGMATQPMVIKPKMSKAAVAAARATAQAGSSAFAVAPTPTSGTGKAKGGSSTWPPQLRNYVERAFTRAKTDEDRKITEESLKKVINEAEAAGELWVRNWDIVPLPDLSRGSAGQSLSIAMAIEASKAKARAVTMGPAQNKNSPKGQQGKRKWGKPAMQVFVPAAGSIEEAEPSPSDDPIAAAKKARRAQRFGDGYADGAVSGTSGTPKAPKSIKQRLTKAKFYSGGAGIVTKAIISAAPGEEIDWSAHTIQGTCQALEKSYFRLTCAPDPATVRPEPVLRRALDRLLRLMREKKENFFYAQDQFKAMRQDCTVQHIRNAFTVEVYEAHARAALDYGEMGDYIQCQTKLNELYADGIPGCNDEFTAYYLLHLVAHSQLGGEDGRLQRTALMDRLRKLTREEKARPEIAHALRVREATALDNPSAFFKLKAAAPNLGGCLMAIQEEQMRFNAMTVLTKALKPTIPVLPVARILGFVLSGTGEKGTERKCQECIEWLEAHGAVVKLDAGGAPSAAKVACKESAEGLYIPEKENACAHGDANLAVDDFMKRAAAV